MRPHVDGRERVACLVRDPDRPLEHSGTLTAIAAGERRDEESRKSDSDRKSERGNDHEAATHGDTRPTVASEERWEDAPADGGTGRATETATTTATNAQNAAAAATWRLRRSS